MLKIRAMGTVEDLQEFRSFLEQDSGYRPESVIRDIRNKGTDQYYRMYMDISRERREDTRKWQMNHYERRSLDHSM